MWMESFLSLQLQAQGFQFLFQELTLVFCLRLQLELLSTEMLLRLPESTDFLDGPAFGSPRPEDTLSDGLGCGEEFIFVGILGIVLAQFTILRTVDTEGTQVTTVGVILLLLTSSVRVS